MAFKPVRGHTSPDRYPETEDKARHLFRHRHENGLAPAFVKCGNRVLFDPDRIEALLAERAASSVAA
jgi:hypothetical protein